jgi:hypothetical protein
MKLRLKEDPKEWRKTACLSALGVGIICTLLRRRHIISGTTWVGGLAFAAGVGLWAWIRPQTFRGYYRLSGRLGFCISQFVGRIVLAGVFFLLLTPLGLAMRLFGKDPLKLKRQPKAATFWIERPEGRPLDRLF